MNAQSNAPITRRERRFHLPDWLFAALVILGCLGLGNVITHALGLRVPGSVFGMLLLVVILRWRGEILASRLRSTSHALIAQLGLFFVPVGAGLITVREVIAAQWLAIVAAMIGSFLVGLLAAAGAAYGTHRLLNRAHE